MLVQSPNFITPETGYIQGFAAGRDPYTKKEWLLHCPVTIAMARSVEANLATSNFYIVIGQATRHIDRHMSSFGRVIYCMPTVQGLLRADMNNASGVIEDETKRSKIKSVKLASDIPPNERLNIEVQVASSAPVKQRLASARTLDNDFFHFKGNGNIDLCYYQLESRVSSN
jgi:peptidylprolyl isomerase